MKKVFSGFDLSLNSSKRIFENVALIVGTLFIYTLIDKFIRRITFLPEEFYFEPFLLPQVLKYTVGTKYFYLLLSGLALLIILLIVSFKNQRIRDGFKILTGTWKEIPQAIPVRLLLALAFLLICWPAVSGDINLYFNQPYYLDRLLIIILAILTFWRPIFLFPFLLQFIAFYAQFHQPFGLDPGITEINYFLRFIALFGASLIVASVTLKFNATHFLFLICCLTASMYWGSGIGKFELDWITHPYVHLMLPGAYSAGWLAFLEPETIVATTKKLALFTKPLMIFTLFVEWACLLFIRSKFTLKLFLICFIMFHFGVFLYSGMFLWKWILFEIALLVFFIRVNKDIIDRIFTFPNLIYSVFIIAFSGYWFEPRNLSWYDTPVSHTYRFEAIGESGQIYHISPLDFNPYDALFTLGTFDFQNKEPQLTGIWNITSNRTIANELVKMKSEAEILELEKQIGIRRYHKESDERFDQFITTYFSNWNERKSRKTILSYIPPPPHLFTFRSGERYNGNENISSVNVYQITSVYDGHRYYQMRKTQLKSLEIPK